MNRFLFLTTFLLLSVVALGQGQNREAEIKKIKAMYSEVQGYFARESNSNCMVRTKKTNDGISFHGTFTQEAIRCSYQNDYQILFANFEGWEWSANINYYYKAGRLFFVLINNYNVCGMQTQRIYYNTSGSAIKVMLEIDDCSDGVQKKNQEVLNREDRNEIITYADAQLSEALQMLE